MNGAVKRKAAALTAMAVLIALPALTACTERSELAALTARHGRTDYQAPSPKKKAISLVLRARQGDYSRTIRMGAEAAAKEFNVELAVAAPDDEDDAKAQLELVHQIVKQGTDAIVLAASDDKALAEAVDRAAGQNIPVVAIESEIESAKVRSFIGINNAEAGRKAGKKLLELLEGRGRVAIVSSGPGAGSAVQRERGVLEELAGRPGVELAGKEYCAGGTACGSAVAGLLAPPVRADGIVALNAAASLSVAAEVERLGMSGRVKIVAFDSTPEELELLQDGVIQATIIQNPFSMGYLGVKYAVDTLGGKRVPERFDTGTKVIDRESMFWSDNQKLLFPFVK